MRKVESFAFRRSVLIILSFLIVGLLSGCGDNNGNVGASEQTLVYNAAAFATNGITPVSARVATTAPATTPTLTPTIVSTVLPTISIDSGWYLTKQANEDKYAARQTSAALTPTPKIREVPPTIPPVTHPSGIFNNQPGPFSSSTFRVVNIWQEYVGDNFVQVYSGYAPGQPERQLLVVSTVPNSDPLNGSSAEYLVPGATSPLAITKAENNVLTLTAQDGTTFTFNVVTRSLAKK